jgi:hypothetical protein
MHKPFLMNGKGVTLGKGGLLSGMQDNGSACTGDQLSAIIFLASDTRPIAHPFSITRSIHRSSPM